MSSTSETKTVGTESQPEGCIHIMKGGSRKGSVCGGSIHTHSVCWYHDPEVTKSRNARIRARAAEAKLANRTADERELTEDKLREETLRLSKEMKSIGGWGAVRHGEFHAVRSRWRDATEQLRASLLNLMPETRAKWSKRPSEYRPGGPRGGCVDEECDCIVVCGEYDSAGGCVDRDGEYHSDDDDCEDGRNCEHGDGEVHDCGVPPDHAKTPDEALSETGGLEERVRLLCRFVADFEHRGSSQDAEKPRVPRTLAEISRSRLEYRTATTRLSRALIKMYGLGQM